DDREFLPSGDMPLTLHSAKYSGRTAVVVRFSGSQKGRPRGYKSTRSKALSPDDSMTRCIVHKLATHGHRGDGASADQDLLVQGIVSETFGRNVPHALAGGQELNAQRVHVVELVA